MGDFLFIDMSPLLEQFKSLEGNLREKLEMAAHDLTIQTHAHIAEEAANKLHSRLRLFQDHLKWEELDKGIFAVVIEPEAVWIEDGIPAHDMLENLLKSPKAKHGKNGRYLVIPFKHSGGATQQRPMQRTMLAAIKNALKERNIPYMSTERHPDGAPKTGLLHKFDLNKPSQQGPIAPGQIGPQGQRFQSHARPSGEEGPGGRPFTWGVRVYQKAKSKNGMPDLGSDGLQKAERGIFTFRVASEKQKGSGLWQHPGLGPMNFLDDAYGWASNLWDTQIAPAILESI